MGKKQPISSRKDSTSSKSSTSSSWPSNILWEGVANIQIMVAEPVNSDDNDRNTESVKDILKEVQ